MKIEHITKKDLRAFKLSWAEVERVLEAESEEGMQLEYIRTRGTNPIIAFEEGMEMAADGHEIESDNWVIVTGYQSRQAMIARTHREHLTSTFKDFIKNGRMTEDELYQQELGKSQEERRATRAARMAKGQFYKWQDGGLSPHECARRKLAVGG